MQKNNSGFTLIETLIYISLFAFIIGGCLLASYQIIRSTDTLSTRAMLGEEMQFVLRKIEWASIGASNITVSSGSLRFDYPGSITYTFSLTAPDKQIMLNLGSGPEPITTTRISTTTLLFTGLPGTPEGVETQITLEALGKKVSATSTLYLR